MRSGIIQKAYIATGGVQTYETDRESVQLVIATLSSVFPKVELWQAGAGDLLLVFSQEDEPWQLSKVRERMKREPFATGVRNLWGTVTAEAWGKFPEWNEQVLRFQRDVYEKAKHPDAARVAKNYERWQKSVWRSALESTTGKCGGQR
jgi:hypothetical protein